MQTALTGVVERAHLLGRAGEGLVCVVADGAVGHRREHNRNLQLEARGQVRDDLAVFVALDLARLFAEVSADFHRLTQRVDGRVGDLRCVDQHLIPVNRIVLRVAHGGQQRAAGACLTVDLHNGLALPVCVLAEGVIGLDDLQCAGRAEGDTAVAVDTFALIRLHAFEIDVVVMYFVCALSLTGAAGDAAVAVADYFILRI